MGELATSLLVTFANNKHLVYGREIAKQIPASHAARAISELQIASFAWGLIRLMALWDKPSLDRSSIPTVAKLIDDAEVKCELRRKIGQDWADLGASEAECRDRQGEFDILWRRVSRRVRAAEASGRLASFRDYRDAFIAHNLKPPAGYKSPKYGQEMRLLRFTMRALHELLLILTNTDHGFGIDATRAEEAAADFWDNMELTIEDQSPSAVRARKQLGLPASATSSPRR